MPTTQASKKPKIVVTREKIIEAARAVLAAPMAHNVSMESVAVAAHVSRRTIFNHFPTREALLYEVVLPILEEGNSLIEAGLAKPPEGIVDFFSALYGLWESWGPELAVFRGMDINESQRLKDLHTTYRINLGRLAEAALSAEGLNPDKAPAVCGLVHNAYLPLLVSMDTNTDQAELRRRFDTAMTGLVRAVVPH